MAIDVEEFELQRVRLKRLELLELRTEAAIEELTLKRDELRRRREDELKGPLEKDLEKRLDEMVNPESQRVMKQRKEMEEENSIKENIDALDLQNLKQAAERLEREGKFSEARDLIQYYKEKNSLNLNRDPIMEIGKKSLDPSTRRLVEFWELMNRWKQRAFFGAGNAAPSTIGVGIPGTPGTGDYVLKLKIVLKRDEKGRLVRDEAGKFVPENVQPVWPWDEEQGGPDTIIRHIPASKYEQFLMASFTGNGELDYSKLETLGIWDRKTIKENGARKQSARDSLRAVRDFPQGLKDQQMLSVLPHVVPMSEVIEIIEEPVIRDGMVVYRDSGEQEFQWTVVLRSGEIAVARKVRTAIKKRMGMDVEVLTFPEGQKRFYAVPSNSKSIAC